MFILKSLSAIALVATAFSACVEPQTQSEEHTLTVINQCGGTVELSTGALNGSDSDLSSFTSMGPLLGVVSLQSAGCNASSQSSETNCPVVSMNLQKQNDTTGAVNVSTVQITFLGSPPRDAPTVSFQYVNGQCNTDIDTSARCDPFGPCDTTQLPCQANDIDLIVSFCV